MIRRLAIFFAIWMCACAAAGMNAPAVLEPGWTAIANIPQLAPNVTISARMKLEKDQQHWALAWNWTDSSNCTLATVSSLPLSKADIYGRYADVAIVNIIDGQPQEICSAQVPCDDEFTIKLCYDGFTARIYAGSDSRQLVGNAPIDCSIPTQALLWCEKPMQCLASYAWIEPAPEMLASAFTSIDELKCYLSVSDDPAEGLWTHLDRDIYEDNLSLGGKYTLATVANGQGAYDIIYISGASVNPTMWKPLSVKGTLTPTIFQGNYDLIWIDANGMPLTDDNNADIDPDAAILTLRFPIYRAQLRLRRAPLTSVDDK